MKKFSILKSNLKSKKNKRLSNVAEVCCIHRTFKRIETPTCFYTHNLIKSFSLTEKRINLN